MPSTINAKNTSSGLVLTPDASGQLELQTADTTRMTIDVNGNVGVGTSSPTFKVSSTGDIVAGFGNNAGGGGGLISQGSVTTGALGANAAFLDNDGAGLTRIRSYGSNTSTYGAFVFQGATSNNTQAERMRIDSSGNVIITDTTNSSLSAVGCYNETTGSGANMVIASNGFIVRSTSSLKYKQNVKDATHGLADVLKLRPVTYESKKESESGITYGGLIAEEVHDAGLTEFVQYADDGTPDALSYGHMVSLAFKAIQELKAELDTVKAELAELKGAA